MNSIQIYTTKAKAYLVKRKWLLLSIALLILFILPEFLSPYFIRLSTTFFMWAGLAQAWNIIGGTSGYIAFGNAGFFGISAYAMAICLLKYNVPFFFGMLIGGVLSSLIALMIGGPVLRLKGHYFALVTLGFAEALRGIVENWASVTGGGAGLTLPLMQSEMGVISKFFYFQMLLILISVMFVYHAISKTKLGYALIAIREDEDAAGTLGIKQSEYKLFAFSISAFFTGLIGAGYAYWITYIDPLDVFSLNFSIQPVIMCLLGGIGTFWGPVIGTIIWELLSELIWSHFLNLHQAIMGIAMILVILSIPKGFMVFLGSKRKSIWSLLKENVKKYSV